MTRPALACIALLMVVATVSCDRAPNSASAAAAGAGASPSQTAATPTDWLLGPQPGADFIDSNATEAALRDRLGAAAVRTDSVYVGEGEFEPGTVVFPGDSTRELSILWADTGARARPSLILVSARRAVWRVYPGVGIGTDLRTLESLNGGPFHLYGFAFDYSGTISSFDGGRLDTLWRRGPDLGQAIVLRLGPSDSAPATLLNQVMGERNFSSRDSAMALLNPRVYQMLIRPR